MIDKRTTILTIAGSDNTSGAGIQADIKTSCILGVYCLSAITTVTSQNSEKLTFGYYQIDFIICLFQI